MRKIIQFLRFSRLLLLVILLLFALFAKFARAERATLYSVNKIVDGKTVEVTDYIFVSSDDACSYAGGSPDGPPGFKPICHDGSGRLVGAYFSTVKTCEAKELTHNGTSDNVPGTPKNMFWLRAPKGLDAGDWYSDKFTTCENNCIVSNSRAPLFPKSDPHVRPDGRSVTEDDGTSRSLFFKSQTGVVCVNEKQKPDVITPPDSDDGDSADGNGQSDSGDANGSDDGQGSQNEGNGSSGSGNDGQKSEGSGESGDGSDGSSGSGSGSGGSQGGSGDIGPGGGGSSGGENGQGEGEGSEGSDSGQSDGNGESGGGSGDTGGGSSEDGSGEGEVDTYLRCPSGKGSYKKGTEPSPECAGTGGDGEGEGSVSAGNCEADTPPVCKGDPVQCYIATEQWRTACAAMGKGGKVEDGDCEGNVPPKCEGDITQCYIAKQQWYSACEAQAQRDTRDGLKEYADGKAGIIDEVDSADADKLDKALEKNSDKLDMNNIIDTKGFGWSRSCPASKRVDMGIFGQFEIDTSMLCDFAKIIGKLLVGLNLLLAVRFIFA